MEEKTINIFLNNNQAEFFKFCCQYQTEIEKLKECDFFNYQTGRILIDKASGKIRELESQKKFKWPK